MKSPFFSAEMERRKRLRTLYRHYIARTDWFGFLIVLSLSITGIFFIYSAQLYGGGRQYLLQSVWLMLGLGVYVGVSLTDYRILYKYSHWLWIGAMLLLLIVAFDNPLSMAAGGARRWINLRFFALQPSEAAKAATLIMVATLLARSDLRKWSDSVGVLGSICIVIIPPIVLIFLQPDLGSALIIPPMVLSMLFVSRLSLRFFAVVILLSTLLMGIIAWDIHGYIRHIEVERSQPEVQMEPYEEHSWFPLRDYQRNRIVGFIAPQILDPHGTGNSWNLIQSLISVGSGGLDGKGWTSGTQAMLGYLPKSIAHTDFIFSVLAEETGFIGGFLVIGLCSLLLVNSIRIAGLSKDRFGMLLCVGVTVIFAVHLLVNVGMTLGLMPITGVPLPFLSYGGSFLLSCCFLQGIVQSVYRWRKP